MLFSLPHRHAKSIAAEAASYGLRGFVCGQCARVSIGTPGRGRKPDQIRLQESPDKKNVRDALVAARCILRVVER
ncbi:MAG: hypothetical protein KDI72_12740, partial [Xanthomonadales bacterium]|nr:hypothetical protein [Xanthomonadales bacterium]